MTHAQLPLQMTALMLAARNGRSDCVLFLVANGSNVNAANKVIEHRRCGV